MAPMDTATLTLIVTQLATMLGVVYLLSNRIDRVREELIGLTTDGDAVTQGKIDELDRRLTRRMDRLEGRMEEMEGRLAGRVDELAARLTGRMDGLEGRMDSLAARMDSLGDQLASHREWVTLRVDELSSRAEDRHRDLLGQLQALQGDVVERIDRTRTELGGRLDVAAARIDAHVERHAS